MMPMMKGRGGSSSRVFDSSEIDELGISMDNNICNTEHAFVGGVRGGDGGGGVEQSLTPRYHLDEFRLFQDPSNFYMVGADKERRYSKVLTIGRSESSNLKFHEDPNIYSYNGYKLLLPDSNEANNLKHEPKFVTNCYGIAGFIKFLGPYYAILITKRREIGQICGHPIYSVSEYKMMPISHSTVWYMDNLEKENRYNKLMKLVDFTKNFIFSYSYPIMHSLQRNLCQKDSRQLSDGNMFVWNEALTRQIRQDLKNTLWTVALIHGFFKQMKLTNQGKSFIFTLIARRLTQFAGTRYHTRGVNRIGHAANDVEIEQIVSPAIHGDLYKINAVLQNRGSIPLRWSQQKPSLVTYKPDIIISAEENNNYQATRLHFEHLRQRYEDPIFILNLVKTNEKKLRETLLHNEFEKAIAFINENSSKEEQLEFWSLDLNAHYKSLGVGVMKILKEYAARALKPVGMFSSQIHRNPTFETLFDLSGLRIDSNCSCCLESNNKCKKQKGILRTNCLDSLDRTNVAQYMFAVEALVQQLHDLQITETSELDSNGTLPSDIMSCYEDMGNALAEQYASSAAQSKIFSKMKGQWKATIQLQELLKSTQRHYNNALNDANKQTAIDLVLGNFHPEVDESTSLNTNQDKQPDTGSEDPVYLKSPSRSVVKSKSDSDLLNQRRSDDTEDCSYTSETSSCVSDYPNFRYNPFRSSEQFVCHLESHWYGSACDCNNIAHKLDPSQRSSGSLGSYRG